MLNHNNALLFIINLLIKKNKEAISTFYADFLIELIFHWLPEFLFFNKHTVQNIEF